MLFDMLTGRLQRIICPAHFPSAAMILAEVPGSSAALVSASLDCHLVLTDSTTGAQVAAGLLSKPGAISKTNIKQLAYDSCAHRLFFSGAADQGAVSGIFDDRFMGRGAVWVRYNDSPAELVLPPWGCRDCCLSLPACLMNECSGARLNHSAEMVDLSDGLSKWGVNLQPLKTRSEAGHGNPRLRQNSRPLQLALMHSCIVVGTPGGLVSWRLPTWQRLSLRQESMVGDAL